MLSTIIQRQIPIDSEVKFVLKSGNEISGILIEIGHNHVSVETDGKITTILLEMIGVWEVLDDKAGQEDNISSGLAHKDNVPVGKESIEQDISLPIMDDVIESEHPVASPQILSNVSDNLDAQVQTGDESEVLHEVLEQTSLSNNTQSLNIAASDVLEMFDDIVSGIQTKLQSIELEVSEPDFSLSPKELRGHSKESITRARNRVVDMYSNAVKINELDPKYGRFQRIEKSLEDLADQYPDVPSVQRFVGHFFWRLGHEKKAMKYYKTAAHSSFAASDWYDLAVLALGQNETEVARDSFEQFFRRSGATNGFDAWCIYVSLCLDLASFSFLSNWIEIGEDGFIENELQDFFEVGVYALKLSSKDSVALDLVNRSLEVQSIDALVKETYQSLVEEIAPHLLDTPQRAGEDSQSLIEEAISHSLLDTNLFNGQIYSYKADDGYGFLHDEDGIEYFFNVNEIHKADLVLEIQNLRPYETVPVIFEATETYKGPRAVRINRRKARLTRRQPQDFPRKLEGQIYSYKSDNSYGFLRSQDGQEYFFHRSAVVDKDLLVELDDWAWRDLIPVFFEVGHGARGKRNPLATRLSLYRNLNDIFDTAKDLADAGEYEQAVEKLGEVLSYDPDFSSAREFHHTWQQYATIPNIPRGKSIYARAKRAQLIEKDDDTAEQLFREAIKKKDGADSAVRDLTFLLAQQGKQQEAIEFLRKHRGRIPDQKSVDNMLINLYHDAGQFDQAITLIQGKLTGAPGKGKNSRLLAQIANLKLEQGNFSEAEEGFRKILKYQPNNVALERNLAISLIKQERFLEAEETLNTILSRSPDPQAIELLKTIENAKKAGLSATSITIETTLSDFSTEVRSVTRFLLSRSEFAGVPSEQVKNKDFRRSDIKKLERLATQLSTSRPKDRSEYYLSAARIISILDDNDDPDQFYRYLGRSLASRGDAAVTQTKPLDIVREFYCEALSAYDHIREPRREQDAYNALIRYLYSILGPSRIPIKPDIPSVPQALERVFKEHPDPNSIFNDIAYLIMRSRFAAERILRPLFENARHRKLAMQYLNSKDITISSTDKGKEFDKFVRLWGELRENRFSKTQEISNELRLLHGIEFTTASLEHSINRISHLEVHFRIDQQRVQRLQQILQIALDLLKEQSFEEQERLCNLINVQCEALLNEVEEDPTGLSVEQLYPILGVVKNKAHLYLQELYLSSMPQITLRLAVETYAQGNNRDLDVQIAIENKVGCSPAESLDLIVIAQEDEATFELKVPEIKLDGSLRGGTQHISLVPIRLTDTALSSKSFSLSMYAQYHVRSGEIRDTPVTDFSIRLYSEDEYEKIENPYAAYAEGGPVSDLEMFYGRQELIGNAAQAIQSSTDQAKSIVIFGQKRAGKSSVLYHLKRELHDMSGFLILDLGNIGSIIDPNSEIPFLYQILWKILNELDYAIEDKTFEGFDDLSLSIPDALAFYQHPTPLVFFNEIFDKFKRGKNKSSKWKELQAVLLIDEFSYIYGQIVEGTIPESFMKNWKALLQKNYFSAVLAGQDVMPKFKQRFPNEFGTSQDERVSYLMPTDAKKLIDEPICIGGRNGESRYREQAINRILSLTAGSPFYIQIFCNRLIEYMNRQKAIYITEANVEHVKDELISGVNALGKDKFENLFNSGDTSQDAISDEDTLKVLTEIALNSRTGPCNKSNIAVKTTQPIDTILNDLVDREVVERSRGEYYQIRVQLFEEWLVTNR